VSDRQRLIALLALCFYFLLVALWDMHVCWRDGMVRRSIKRRWRKDVWYDGADAWRYGLTRVVESMIVVALMSYAIFEFLKGL
jgi:hypothetical protein